MPDQFTMHLQAGSRYCLNALRVAARAKLDLDQRELLADDLSDVREVISALEAFAAGDSRPGCGLLEFEALAQGIARAELIARIAETRKRHGWPALESTDA